MPYSGQYVIEVEPPAAELPDDGTFSSIPDYPTLLAGEETASQALSGAPDIIDGSTFSLNPK